MGRDRQAKRRRSKTHNTRPDVVAEANHHSARYFVRHALFAVAVLLIGGLIAMSVRSAEREQTAAPGAMPVAHASVANPTTLHVEFTVEPKTLNELLALPVEQLDQVDIARMNLLCASGLPSTKGLAAPGIDHALSVLDEWAKRVAFETDRHLYRVNDPQYADHYGHSEAQFRAEMLAQVLTEDLGVKYNPQAIGNFSFADVSTGFIHGMIPGPGQTTADTPGGTCTSMPVLYVAVGRRLGYPLKLSTTDSHIFARWDGENHPNPAWRERFNCETTNGFHRFDDDYYHTWPRPVSDQQIAVNGFLKSLSPAQEMAEFLAARGHHGVDVGQFGFAARCYENACRYDMTRPCFRGWFVDAAMRSGYRPATPALAQLVQQRRQIAAAMASGPMLDGMPRPSQTRASLDPHMPVAPRVGGWQPPQPTTPGVLQPIVPSAQQFNYNHLSDPFRSEP
jgi:hypothetical protein